jgi:hypothetical protein
MDSDTIIYVVWGACLIGLVLWTCFVYLNRRLRAKRLLLLDLFNGYFRGHVTAHELGQRARQIASRRFTGSPAFYAIAISAFQNATDATVAKQSHSAADEGKLLRLLAALKVEFGLTDRYQIEAWRAGRE